MQIYGNSIDHDQSTTVGINLSELDQYVRERYVLLEELLDIPKKITKAHYQKYKEKKIELSSDPWLSGTPKFTSYSPSIQAIHSLISYLGESSLYNIPLLYFDFRWHIIQSPPNNNKGYIIYVIK